MITFKEKFYLVVFMFVFLTGYGQNQYFNTESEVEGFSEKITELFSQNKVLDAFSELQIYWPLPESELELIKEKAVKGINLMERSFGTSLGIKKVKHENLSGVFIRDVYFIKYKVTVLRFVYVYYKNDNGWLLNSFEFDEDFEEEFKN